MTTAPLPDNRSDLERILVEIDGRTLAIDADIVRRVKDPATCPEPLLPWLAWEESVDVWDPDWPEAWKRYAIAQSWHLHRHKGSRQSIADALELFQYGAKLEEWFEYGGAAYLFRLRVALPPGQAMPFSQLVSMTRTALTYKNVRSHLETIFIQASTPPTTAYVGGYITMKTVLQSSYAPFTEMAVAGRAHIGAATHTHQQIRLG
ncbi:MAG: phage tail protein I [Mesorhizobium sp.]|nr:phage tail protein I [Mesorhizobium sp.]